MMYCEFLKQWNNENDKVYYCDIRMKTIHPLLCNICQLCEAKEEEKKYFSEFYRRIK